MKYGVIAERDLCDDLLDWSYLYIAGRLHKPVLWLKSPDEESTRSALKENLNNALHTSLLLLPDSFTKEELYTCVTSLSYIGDFRQYVGEDRNKVRVWRLRFEETLFVFADYQHCKCAARVLRCYVHAVDEGY